jgi:integrase
MGVSRVFQKGGMLVCKVQSKRREIAPHNVSLAEEGCASEAEAKRWAIVRALKDGTYRQPSVSLTFDEFMTKYAEFYTTAAGPERRPTRENSWLGVGGQLRLFFEFMIAHYKTVRTVRDVLPKHCEAYRDYRLAQEKALSTVKLSQLLGHAAWAWAIRRDYAAQNPWHGMKFPKRVKTDPRNLSVLEIRKVFPIAAAEKPDIHARMALALYAGLRLSECGALLQRDLIWGADGYIRLGPGKDGEPRTTLFPDELQTILAPWRKPTEPLSPVLGLQEPHHAQKYMARLSEALAVPFSFHDLRKSFAGLLAEAGVPVTRIRDYLGHSSTLITEGYYVGRSQFTPDDNGALRLGLARTGKARRRGVG